MLHAKHHSESFPRVYSFSHLSNSMITTTNICYHSCCCHKFHCTYEETAEFWWLFWDYTIRSEISRSELKLINPRISHQSSPIWIQPFNIQYSMFQWNKLMLIHKIPCFCVFSAIKICIIATCLHPIALEDQMTMHWKILFIPYNTL